MPPSMKHAPATLTAQETHSLTHSAETAPSVDIMQEAADIVAVSTTVQSRHHMIQEPPTKRAMVVSADRQDISADSDNDRADEVARE